MMMRMAAAAMMVGLAISANAAAASAHGDPDAIGNVSMNVPPMLIRSVTAVPQLTVLPDLQSAHVRPLVMPARRLFVVPVQEKRENALLPDAPSVAARDGGNALEAMPGSVRFRRMTNERFNTTDGSFGDFAICYRLAKRYALQVVPGDPAPVKLPVSTIQNNTGVTIGMVVRVGR